MSTVVVRFICLNCGSTVYSDKCNCEAPEVIEESEFYDGPCSCCNSSEDYPTPPVITTNLFGYNIEESLVDEFYSWCEQKGLGANQEIFEVWVECSDMDADEEEKYLFDKGLL